MEASAPIFTPKESLQQIQVLLIACSALGILGIYIYELFVI